MLEKDIDLKYVLSQEPRFAKLSKRQDDDMKLYYLEDFVMRDANEEAIPNVTNVTLNDPKTLVDRCVSILGSADRHINSLGVPEQEQDAIEDEYDLIFEQNDDVLSYQMIEPLEFCMDWYSCNRGWIVNRTLVYKDGEMMQAEIMPLDPRWTRWDVDRRGIVWGSNQLRMSRETIEDAYHLTNLGKAKDALVTEIYTRNLFRVYVGKDEIPTSPVEHNIGECPIFVTPVPTEPFRNNEQGLLRQGEGVYASNRNLYFKADELASIWATMQKMQFMQPIGFISPRGRKLKQRPYGVGVVINLREGEKFIEVPTKELTASAQALFGQYSARLQRGGLSDIEYGQLAIELSSLALAQLSESRDQLFVPRLKAKSRMLRHSCMSIRRQILGNGFPLTLEEDEPKIPITREVFKKKFFITVEYHAISPEQNIANLNTAGVAKEFLSRYTINREVLKMKHPDKEESRRDLEMARREVRELALFDYAVGIAPIKNMTQEQLNSQRAKIIYWKLGQETKGALDMSGLIGETQGSQKKLKGLLTPTVAEHVTKAVMKRKRVTQIKRGREAQTVEGATEGEISGE